jgi:ATP-grasp domain, R2K clade family 3
MRLHFLFPASPLNPRMIDEAFQDQAIALKMAGFGTSVFSIGDNRIYPAVPEDSTVVYRGWMMHEAEYALFYGWLHGHNLKVLTSMQQYVAAHYLPNWYPLLEQYTPSTSVFPKDTPLFKQETRMIGHILGEHVKTMRGLHLLSGHGDGSEWHKFQMKDYVKSLKTDGGSVLTDVEEITPTLEKMEKYRGIIEGGICLRAYEEFLPGSETRYFMLNGRYYGQQSAFDIRAMRILEEVKTLIPSPFWSIDIASRLEDGEFRIVEIGDGQVSDLVGWTEDRFAEIWK